MIRCLCTVLYLAQSLMDILRCLTDGLCKQLIRHKMRAGTGCEKSAVLYKTHCTEIDLTVSLDSIFYRASGFRKCRRIQYHNIKFLSLLLKLGKKLKNILTEEFHCSVQAVQTGVSSCLQDCSFRRIHTENTLCPCNSRIQGKRAGMCKAVQNLRPLAELLDSKTVIFLIQEKSGLLPVPDIYFIFHTVLFNLNKCRKFFSDKSLGKFHSLLAAYLCITSLIDSADPDSILSKDFLQCIYDHFFKTVDSQCKRLYNKHI